MLTAKALREKRADLITRAQAKIKELGDNITAEDTAAIDGMMDEAAELQKQADTIGKVEAVSASLSDRLEPAASDRRSSVNAPRTMQVRSGRYGQNREVQVGRRGETAYVEAFGQFLAGDLSVKQFAGLQTTADERGGYLVTPEQFAAGMLKTLDDTVWIRQFATVHTLTDAASLGIRCRTSKLSAFRWGTELGAPGRDVSLKFGLRSLTPNPLTGEILVSRTLLRNGAAGAEQIVNDELARDAGEVQEDAFLTGSGDKRPLGLFVASDDGIPTSRDVSTSNTSTNITAAGLIEAQFALKEGHRKEARWLFSRTGIKKVVLLTDDNGEFLWRRGSIEEGKPDLLLGSPCHESERVPSTFTTGLYVGIYGNFRHYTIADSLAIGIRRIDDVHYQTNEVAFVGELWTDGMPTLAEAFARVKLA